MTNRIIIAKTGYNALTETDPNHKIFDSQYGTLKYFVSGSGSLTITASGAGQVENTATVAHNLGYVPFFYGYVYDGSTYYINPVNSISGFDYEMYADATNLYLYGSKFFFSAGSISLTFYYKIFKNDLGL